jgi:hypothetical protein
VIEPDAVHLRQILLAPVTTEGEHQLYAGLQILRLRLQQMLLRAEARVRPDLTNPFITIPSESVPLARFGARLAGRRAAGERLSWASTRLSRPSITRVSISSRPALALALRACSAYLTG